MSKLSIRDFRKRFTLTEKRRIYTLAKTVVDIEIYLAELHAVDPAVGVNVEDPETIGGVHALAAGGLLDEPVADRVAALLAPAAALPGGIAIGATVLVLPPLDVRFAGQFRVIAAQGDGLVLEGAETADVHVHHDFVQVLAD
jgi:hypothetical protein